MDNVTHSLTGLAIARCGTNRISPRATLLLLLSANAPDADIVVAPWGALPYFEAHRGYTHCLLGLPCMAALCVLAVAAIYRTKLPWFRAWVLCCLGVASHLLLDWTNSYGVRLLLPFSSRWYHVDLNSLTDAIILCVLAMAAVWPWFSRFVSSEIGSRKIPVVRATAVAALVFVLLFDVGRFVARQKAIAVIDARIYDGMTPLSAAALPDAIDPWRWTGVVETANSFAEMDVNLLHEFDPDTAEIFYKRPFDAAIEAARRTEPFRYFQYFSRFPIWSEEPISLPNGAGRRIELSDLRFGVPGGGAFHSVAVVDNRGLVLQSIFTYGSGAGVGRN